MAIFSDDGGRRENEGSLSPGQSRTSKRCPSRLVVPHRCAWKREKWVRGFMLLDDDCLGFWERNGYHAYRGPWKEQRSSGQ